MHWYFIPLCCQIMFHCMNISHFLYPFISQRILGLLLLFYWVVSSNAALNVCVWFYFVWMYVFISIRYISRSEISDSYDNSMLNILRNCQTVFQNDCIILHFHRQHMRVLISPHPHQCLIFYCEYKVISHCSFDLHFWDD